MANIKHLVDLDLSKNQLLNAVVQNLAAAPSSPVEGQIYWNTASETLFAYDGAAWIDLGSDGVTNLGYTASASNGTVTSSTGNNATIPLATNSNAGLLSPAEHVIVNNQSGTNTGDNAVNSLYSGLVSNVSTNISIDHNASTVDVNSSDGTDGTINAANTNTAGIMSATMYDQFVINSNKVSNVDETVTSISIAANVITYTDENGDDTTIDLSTYLDDSNLARITSGSVNGTTGIATFTRDDATTFTIDMSDFLDAITLNNTLTSTSTTEGLTAAQGKVLKDLIDNLNVGTGTNTGDEPPASTTERGVVELATSAETNTGTDGTRAVTPDGLNDWTGSGNITTLGTIATGAS